ncbi:uncharacterized protein [Lepeophtheirus salmonis]|uniref:Uncharacterized protein n=1 Tax=Lepeophtheirus salmonis TaxID=72036 RepID=A0A0K2SYA1_LEPSM|nr:uncharacterized protein LOC121116462 [Lepeophtheirus salmonis]
MEKLHLIFTLVVPLFLLLRTGQGKIICDVETFVHVGFLYKNCLMKTMQLMSDKFEDPCPLLQKGVKSCIGLTKQCYDERGWQRVVQSNIDKTILVYEQDKKKDSMGFCHLLNATTVDDPKFVVEGIPQKLPDELCTIPEEAILMDGVEVCVTDELTKLLSFVTGLHATLHPPPTQTTQMGFTSMMCENLKEVYNKCAVDKLETCFDNNDIIYHEMNVLESIRVAGTLIAEQLINPNTNRSIEDASAFILQCPVFKDHNLKIMSTDYSMFVWIYIGFALLALIIVLLVIGIFAVRLRMAERFRAIIQKKPYEEFAIPETRGSESPSQSV